MTRAGSRSAALARPRVVLVTRRTQLALLLERHGTHGQARFYLESRGQEIRAYEEADARFEAALAEVQGAIPADQRRTRVDRDDLDRFLFAPDDVVVVVGQDGLVPNAAKYLHGQAVIGINPDPGRYDGVLCPHPATAARGLLAWAEARASGRPASGYRIQSRVMAMALREDGQRLLALNEVFIGHQTHQSARYVVRVGTKEERQSSSGVICSTGTGATGWARSIAGQRGIEEDLPRPEQAELAWFVREPFPSVATGTALSFGLIGPGEALEVVSEMGEGGVLFADGIESDKVEFVSGQSVRVGIAEDALNLVVPA